MEQEYEESKSIDNQDSQSFSDIFVLKEPNVHAAISRDPETKGNKYVLIEPTLLEEEKEE